MNKRNVANSLLVLVLSSLLLVSAACTKKRAAKFPDGAGLDLLVISEYDQRKEELETGDAKGNLFYASSEFHGDKDASKIKVVNYFTSAPLFPKDIQMSGVTKTKYRLIYKITDQKLVIYRNGPENVIAPEEKATAEMEDDKSLSVPVVAYAVTGFYNVLVAKDDNGNKTTRLREEAAQGKEGATHFRISRTPEILNFPDQSEYTVKADYFDGIWYTSSVVAKASVEASGILGRQLSYDSKWESADKIQFIRTQDYILGLNSNYDKRIKIDDDMDKLNHLATVMKFPAKYVDLDTVSKNDKVKYSTDKKKILNWKERQWALIDFKKINSDLIKSLADGHEPIMTNFQMADDFFMFSLQFKGIRLTMSFFKESSIKKRTVTDYVPKVYFYDDFRHFGFFATSKKSMQTIEKYRIGNFELNQFVNRFHPENYKDKSGQDRRRIRFFMTEESTTEEPLLQTVRNSLKSWDFAFKQAGLTDVDVYLDESQRVSLGDIRYNAVNLVRTLTSSSLYGYGPSIADPDTGQIVSATTNVHITSIRDSLVSVLRNYIRHVRGEYSTNYPLGIEANNGGINSIDIAALESMPEAETSIDGTTVISKPAHTLTKKPVNTKNLVYRYGHTQCEFATNNGNLLKNVEKTPACAELREFAKQNKKISRVESCESKDSKDPSCVELSIILKCAEALLPEKIAATVLHELGHNFGLRHNFAASTDAANFTHKFNEKSLKDVKNYSCPSTQKQAGEILARTSSTMEYTDLNEEGLVFIGPYDVEAIRYGYASKIMDSSCQIHELKPTLSINSNLADNRINRLPLKFCTDEHIFFKMDPMCQRFDSGSSPLEVVKTLKSQYNLLFANQNFKYDKARSASPKGLAFYKEEAVFDRMKLLYEQWRIHVSDYVGQKNASLEIYDSKTFKTEVLEKMKNDETFGKYYAEYYEATREMFKFLLKVMFLPDRYCLVEKADKSYLLLEMQDLMTKVEIEKKVKESSCTSLNIAAEIATHGTFLREVGFYFENQKATPDMHSAMIDLLNVNAVNSELKSLRDNRDDVESYWDIIGTRLEKDSARQTMYARTAVGFMAQQKALEFSMLDEPDLREILFERLSDRILYGVAYEDIFPDAEKYLKGQKFFMPKWRSELPHISKLWANMETSIALGKDKKFSTLERSRAWESANAQKEKADLLPEEQKFEMKSGDFIIAPSKDNTFTIALFKRLKELLKMQKEEPAKFQENRQEYEAQIVIIAEITKITL